MSGCEPNHGLQIWLDLRLNDDPEVKLSLVGWCLMLVFVWVHRGSTESVWETVGAQGAEKTGPEVINFFFMLNSTEHEISTAHKN